ncbi:MAG: hypothetical protein IPJ77_08865 [Planctomycetes bacterium]|nr:hypothetical protein [Planctomycetota bacterium]
MLLPIVLSLTTALPAQDPSPFAALRQRFERAYDAKDAAACTALWKEAGELVLPLIDADLEGSLKLCETSASPDLARVKAMRARAIWGAGLASDVTGSPLLADYAAAFAGWTPEQAASFRAGQKAYREAGALLKKGDARAALDQAESCALLASNLGDWWGAAMGHEARGRALQSLARLGEALDAWSTARWIQHGLGLASDELDSVHHVADLCFAEARNERGLVAARQGVALAKALGAKGELAALLEREAQLEERLGDAEGAKATRKELEAAKAK